MADSEISLEGDAHSCEDRTQLRHLRENRKIENIELWDDFGGFLWVRLPVQVGIAKEQDEGRDGFHI